jgi:hypothetical protein
MTELHKLIWQIYYYKNQISAQDEQRSVIEDYKIKVPYIGGTPIKYQNRHHLIEVNF